MNVGKAKEILSKLDDSDLLIPNRVGILTVTRNGDRIGYIDFSEEAFKSTKVAVVVGVKTLKMSVRRG